MDIRQLRYYLALVSEKHFARAAAICNISQPTLSGHIRRLEEELGVSLINRGKRYQGLTCEGKRVYDWALRIVNNAECLVDDINLLKGQLKGALKLGVIPSALPIMPLITTPLLDEYPELMIELISLSSIDIIRHLEDYTIHAGVTYLDNEPLPALRTLPLYDETYVLLAPGNSKIAGKDSITWAEAAKLRLCLLESKMQNRRIIDNVFEQVGVHPSPTLVANSILTLYAHVRQGNMCSIIPRNHFDHLGVPSGLKTIELVEPVEKRQIGLVCLNSDLVSPKIAALWQAGKALSQL